MSFRPYPSYRPSGVEWLGHLPEHWRTKPFWALYRRVKRVGFPDEELLSVYRDHGVVRKSDRDDNFNNPSEDLNSYQLVEPGDLAMNKMKAWQGSLGVSSLRGIVSPAYFVFRAAHREEDRYLHYLLRSLPFAAGFMTISKGIRINQWDIDPDHLSQVPVPLPTLEEQRSIVAFLNRETAKIDALVEEQRRLIELLNEKRQAVISHAVTKGLDPTAPIKDSGLESLGEVPADWEVVCLKRCLTLVTSGPRGWSDLLSDEGPIFFQSQNIGRLMEPVFDEANRVQPPDDAESERARLKEGDVVICITGGRTGAVAHISALHEIAYVNQHVCILRPKPAELTGRFLAYFLTSLPGARQLSEATYGLKQGLGLDQLRSLVAAVPDARTQARIVEHLDCETVLIDALMQETEKAILLLNERRAALISAAVTGKIDVRERVTAPTQLEPA